MQISHIYGCAPAPIHSAGVDLLDGRRWERAVSRCGDALSLRYFTAHERRGAQAAASRGCCAIEALGQMFGVKESVVKAVGGLPPGGRLADICVRLPDDDSLGARWPVTLHGALADWAQARQVEVEAGAVPLDDGMTLAWATAQAAGATR
ncbi:hypothetical protein [Streptomyces sp. NPDC007205]|uniref:hypothetical protein n=1 Tax=Streptomyces sp. NPDC007205 TaxID=3154316 RepID=UPI0033E154FF